MKNYNQWLRDTTEYLSKYFEDEHQKRSADDEPLPPHPELEGCFNSEMWCWEYPCRMCDDLIEIDADIDDFDPMYSYCGKGPSCCP